MNVSQAHEHADRAELLYARGDFEGAGEEHIRAAESYLQAIDACEDPSVRCSHIVTDHSTSGNSHMCRSNIVFD
jgi:hypothetical protein